MKLPASNSPTAGITSTTGLPLVIPTQTKNTTARLILRNDLGQVVQQWLVKQNKCTLGNATSCSLRCQLPGIAPHHALLVIGSRQIFIRALAPKLTRDGRQFNEILLTEDKSHFEIAGHRFELCRNSPYDKKNHPEGHERDTAALDRLKFTLARPYELSNRQRLLARAAKQTSVEQKIVTGSTPASPAHLSTGESGDPPKWVTRAIQAALQPLEKQLHSLALPLAEFQADTRKQKLLRTKRRRALRDRAAQKEKEDRKALHDKRQSELEVSRQVEELVVKQSAAMEILIERVSDVTQQLSALERVIAAERDAISALPSVDSTIALQLDVQNTAIERLQTGVVAVSAAMEQLNERQSLEKDQQSDRQDEMQSQLAALLHVVDGLSSRVREAHESVQSLPPFLAQEHSALTEALTAAVEAQTSVSRATVVEAVQSALPAIEANAKLQPCMEQPVSGIPQSDGNSPKSESELMATGPAIIEHDPVDDKITQFSESRLVDVFSTLSDSSAVAEMSQNGLDFSPQVDLEAPDCAEFDHVAGNESYPSALHVDGNPTMAGETAAWEQVNSISNQWRDNEAARAEPIRGNGFSSEPSERLGSEETACQLAESESKDGMQSFAMDELFGLAVEPSMGPDTPRPKLPIAEQESVPLIHEDHSTKSAEEHDEWPTLLFESEDNANYHPGRAPSGMPSWWVEDESNVEGSDFPLPNSTIEHEPLQSTLNNSSISTPIVEDEDMFPTLSALTEEPSPREADAVTAGKLALDDVSLDDVSLGHGPDNSRLNTGQLESNAESFAWDQVKPEAVHIPLPEEAQSDSIGNDDQESVDDESVDEYMRKLLARMRGVPEENVTMPRKAEAQAPSPPKLATLGTPSTESPPVDSSAIALTDSQPLSSPSTPARSSLTTFDSSDPTEPFDPEKYMPRALAPEKSQSLAAMRELANSSARTAIHKSTRQRHLSSIIVKAVVAATGFLVGMALLAINGMNLNIGLIATGASFLVALIWGFDAASSIKPLLQAGLILAPQPSRSPKPALAKNNDSGVH